MSKHFSHSSHQKVERNFPLFEPDLLTGFWQLECGGNDSVWLLSPGQRRYCREDFAPSWIICYAKASHLPYHEDIEACGSAVMETEASCQKPITWQPCEWATLGVGPPARSSPQMTTASVILIATSWKTPSQTSQLIYSQKSWPTQTVKIISEISETEEDKYHIISHIYRI